ncbi:hypothetical protein EYF80_031334 [Liparis tanakae]|uniref:Uncharacterized protein n=1 Tax=Liparis tanakae TaxID=230148 RepID=A0A4Z2H084_9TELE|nr:hypothetical protein EYF80_031334 [Liparis tanakae]
MDTSLQLMKPNKDLRITQRGNGPETAITRAIAVKIVEMPFASLGSHPYDNNNSLYEQRTPDSGCQYRSSTASPLQTDFRDTE